MKHKAWTPEQRKLQGGKIRESWARKKLWREHGAKAADRFFLLKVKG